MQPGVAVAYGARWLTCLATAVKDKPVMRSCPADVAMSGACNEFNSHNRDVVGHDSGAYAVTGGGFVFESSATGGWSGWREDANKYDKDGVPAGAASFRDPGAGGVDGNRIDWGRSTSIQTPGGGDVWLVGCFPLNIGCRFIHYASNTLYRTPNIYEPDSGGFKPAIVKELDVSDVDTRLVVVYQDSSTLYFRTCEVAWAVPPTLSSCSARVAVTTSGNILHHTRSFDVASLVGGGFVVTFTTNDGAGNGVSFRAYRPTATATVYEAVGEAMTPVTNTAGNQQNPRCDSLVELGGFVIAWTDAVLDGSGMGIVFRAGVVDIAAGSIVLAGAAETLVNSDDSTSDQRWADVAASRKHPFVVISWIDDTADLIAFRRLMYDLTPGAPLAAIAISGTIKGVGTIGSHPSNGVGTVSVAYQDYDAAAGLSSVVLVASGRDSGGRGSRNLVCHAGTPTHLVLDAATCGGLGAAASSTACISAALVSVSATLDATIELPAGTFSGPCNFVVSSPVRLVGAGMGVSNIACTGPVNGASFSISGSDFDASEKKRSVSIRDLSMSGGGPVAVAETTDGPIVALARLVLDRLSCPDASVCGAGGGALSLTNVAQFSLMHSVVSGASAGAGNGGGIGFFFTAATGSISIAEYSMYLSNVTLSGCSASAGSGGGLYVTAPAALDLKSVFVTDVRFSGCSAAVDGGGMKVADVAATSTSALMIGPRLTVEACSAGKGGGGMAMESLAVPLVLTDVTVAGCSAASEGGGLAVSHLSATLNSGGLTLTGCAISGCTTNSDGGGVYTSEVSVVLAGATSVSGCSASSGRGGGVLLSSNALVNPPVLAIASSASVSGNMAQNGGGVAALGGRVELAPGSLIGDNTASVSGGGVLVVSSRVHFCSADGALPRVVNNAALVSGGGLFVCMLDSSCGQELCNRAAKVGDVLLMQPVSNTTGAAVGAATPFTTSTLPTSLADFSGSSAPSGPTVASDAAATALRVRTLAADGTVVSDELQTAGSGAIAVTIKSGDKPFVTRTASGGTQEISMAVTDVLGQPAAFSNVRAGFVTTNAPSVFGEVCTRQADGSCSFATLQVFASDLSHVQAGKSFGLAMTSLSTCLQVAPLDAATGAALQVSVEPCEQGKTVPRCTKCPRGMVLNLVDHSAQQCEACPDGIGNASNIDAAPAAFIKCFNADACPGGAEYSSCSGTRDSGSFTCFRCESGLVPDSYGRCNECGPMWVAYVGGFAVIAMFGFTSVWFTSRSSKSRGASRHTAASPAAVIRSGFNFAQLVVLMGELKALQSSTTLLAIVNGISFVSSQGSLSSFSTHCLVGSSFYTRFVLIMLAPWLYIAIAAVVLLARGQIRGLIRYSVVVLFLQYTNIATVTFKVFQCSDPGTGELRLVADPDIRCYEGLHALFVTLALVSMGVYVVGVPVVMLLGMRRTRSNPERFWFYFSYLVNGFSEDMWWYEVWAAFSRKALMAAVVVFITSPSFQLSVAGGLVLCMFAVQIALSPYVAKLLDLIDAIALFVVYGYVTSGAVFLDEENSAQTKDTAEGLVVAAIAGVFVVVVLAVVFAGSRKLFATCLPQPESKAEAEADDKDVVVAEMMPLGIGSSSSSSLSSDSNSRDSKTRSSSTTLESTRQLNGKVVSRSGPSKMRRPSGVYRFDSSESDSGSRRNSRFSSRRNSRTIGPRRLSKSSAVAARVVDLDTSDFYKPPPGAHA
ncbi:uncharacterized protein AMSG_07124 [Thecamonas trahens ATCC 50062]|uniref:Tyrosine-protein kinase ephrin type A/B receptor-like domain-containing protein n=1 Tax=Thecamonas trahens ATCC 50062 TaxID=461836 RepID=A0A0L0DF26_THETB|nr:hypothetical protein AMSG_07124 [Thecamonas trahens ATCC 50062]KNC50889.1 hypothetical protein AMSG_07124 [Thecamonas trahens ATCC 50062]|eukprot:XP_013756595.1 hypothetical protein AMSG_07124 [Thecamonas trahens ATCC 50062]